MLRSSFRFELAVGGTVGARELNCREDCLLSSERDEACRFAARASMIALTNDLGDRNALVGERRKGTCEPKCINGRSHRTNDQEKEHPEAKSSVSARSEHYIALLKLSEK
jgi:hypothetical protein